MAIQAGLSSLASRATCNNVSVHSILSVGRREEGRGEEKRESGIYPVAEGSILMTCYQPNPVVVGDAEQRLEADLHSVLPVGILGGLLIMCMAWAYQ